MNLEPIDTSTTAGKAEVMRLASEGRKVATCQIGYSIWFETEVPQWDWFHDKYSIIAEPVGPEELWSTVIDGDVVMDAYATKGEAEAALNRGWQAVRYIRADLAGRDE